MRPYCPGSTSAFVNDECIILHTALYIKLSQVFLSLSLPTMCLHAVTNCFELIRQKISFDLFFLNPSIAKPVVNVRSCDHFYAKVWQLIKATSFLPSLSDVMTVRPGHMQFYNTSHQLVIAQVTLSCVYLSVLFH